MWKKKLLLSFSNSKNYQFSNKSNLRFSVICLGACKKEHLLCIERERDFPFFIFSFILFLMGYGAYFFFIYEFYSSDCPCHHACDSVAPFSSICNNHACKMHEYRLINASFFRYFLPEYSLPGAPRLHTTEDVDRLLASGGPPQPSTASWYTLPCVL